LSYPFASSVGDDGGFFVKSELVTGRRGLPYDGILPDETLTSFRADRRLGLLSASLACGRTTIVSSTQGRSNPSAFFVTDYGRHFQPGGLPDGSGDLVEFAFRADWNWFAVNKTPGFLPARWVGHALVRVARHSECGISTGRPESIPILRIGDRNCEPAAFTSRPNSQKWKCACEKKALSARMNAHLENHSVFKPASADFSFVS